MASPVSLLAVSSSLARPLFKSPARRRRRDEFAAVWGLSAVWFMPVCRPFVANEISLYYYCFLFVYYFHLPHVTVLFFVSSCAALTWPWEDRSVREYGRGVQVAALYIASNEYWIVLLFMVLKKVLVILLNSSCSLHPHRAHGCFLTKGNCNFYFFLITCVL